MKANLMYKNKDFDINEVKCFDTKTLSSDFELQHIIDAAAKGDKTIKSVITAALFCPLSEKEDIEYRQEALKDALSNKALVTGLYKLLQATFERSKNTWGWLSVTQSPSATFTRAGDLIDIYTNALMEIRKTADENAGSFKSEAFRNLFAMLQTELNDEYFREVQTHLSEIKNNNGLLISADLGSWNQGINYTLRRKDQDKFRRHWTFAPSVTISSKDTSGGEDIEKRKDRALNEAANAMAQASEYLDGFLKLLCNELAFFVGNINLSEKISETGMPFCIPDIENRQSKRRMWNDMYDLSLALIKNAKVCGNDFDSKDKDIFIITGANQGGKTTFLRSLGQTQLMTQCGMIVPAKALIFPIRSNIFSHFRKEEDASMQSGKFDEELGRMDEIADHLTKDSVILFNESFAATNENEGSEIFRQIAQALTENGVEIFAVSHQFKFAEFFKENAQAQFMRAERLTDGERTFRIIEGMPEETAFGEDLYKKVFEKEN